MNWQCLLTNYRKRTVVNGIIIRLTLKISVLKRFRLRCPVQNKQNRCNKRCVHGLNTFQCNVVQLKFIPPPPNNYSGTYYNKYNNKGFNPRIPPPPKTPHNPQNVLGAHLIDTRVELFLLFTFLRQIIDFYKYSTYRAFVRPWPEGRMKSKLKPFEQLCY